MSMTESTGVGAPGQGFGYPDEPPADSFGFSGHADTGNQDFLHAKHDLPPNFGSIRGFQRSEGCAWLAVHRG